MSGSGGVLEPIIICLPEPKIFWRRHLKNGFPAISCWELAKLVEKKRLGLAIHPLIWMKRSLKEGNIRMAELTPEIAVESTMLSNFHSDPADQIIVATARILGLPLITSDKRILSYPDLETLW